jgi:hypothetical protein
LGRAQRQPEWLPVRLCSVPRNTGSACGRNRAAGPVGVQPIGQDLGGAGNGTDSRSARG